MEQLNIEGKRSGDGFVASRDRLISALSQATSVSVEICDVVIGRRGFLGYLKALGGGMVKVIPAPVNASEGRVDGKGLRVICGSHRGIVSTGDWVREKEKVEALFPARVRVSPHYSVIPNLGAAELVEALVRTIPFASSESSRPVLTCVLFRNEGDKVVLASADGFRLALASLAVAEPLAEGDVLIPAKDLGPVASALRRARRLRLGVGHTEGDKQGVLLETETVRFFLPSFTGTFPDYEKLIPQEFSAQAHFDSREALRVAQGIYSLASTSPISLKITEGGIKLANPQGGEAWIEAQTEGEMETAVGKSYLLEALKALGGMATFKLNSPTDPMLFSEDGYRLVVMPMFAPKKEELKAEQPRAEEPKGEQPKGKARRKKGKAQAQDIPAENSPEAEGSPTGTPEREAVAVA